MDSSLRTSRFRFRDHHEMENSPQSESSSDISSLSSEREDEAELQSMTGKGIERLCTELLELKAASEEDFQGSIFANYSVFVGIFAEVESIANEVVQLKKRVSAHKGLLNDLDGIYFKFLSDKTTESTMEEVALGDEQSNPNKLEAHISNVSETLDIHLSENRIDEAIAVLEMEEESSQKMQFEDDFPPDVLESYVSAISERRAMLTLQLTLVAENPRTAAAEFQKVLSRLCRLGYSHLATQLLTKYYHSRIAIGIRDVDCSNSLLHGQYIRELAKFVFSMISQAARSFVMLYGETRPFASELIQWVSEEIELFASSFNNYIMSISQISGGLGKATEAVQIAVSYCSLLESQRLVLRPYLVKHILPCMEEVLHIHIEHFKKVIGIFAATDAWVLGRYLVSVRIKGWCPSTVIGKQSEFCLLTNSGRKFVTVLQTITEDVAPLFTLQMEGSVVGGLVDLFMEYIVILERAITHETNGMEKGGSRINLAESLQQQVSVLVNLSTLKHFFSNLVSTIFGEINRVDPVQNKIQSNGIQDPELESCIACLHDASTQLRAHFFHQFINRLMSLETGPIPGVENCNESQGDHDDFHGVMPSVPFQVLFLELRKLCKLAEENDFEMDWLIELLRELIEAILVWTKINKEMWANTGKNSASHHSDSSHQFILDMHFLMEIARYGSYFFSNPLTPAMLMESAFASVVLDTDRDVDDDDWAINIVTEAIQRLLEIEKTNATLNDDPLSTSEEEIENEFKSTGDSVHEFESSGHTVSEELFEPKEDARATYASEVTLSSKTSISSSYFSPRGGSLDLENKGYSTHRSATNSSDTYGDPEDIESEDDK